MRALTDHAERLSSLGCAVLDDVSAAFSGTVVLFVLGVVLLALAGERMERLELEVAARPAKAFAVGLLGMVAAFAVGVALCVTVIGIPFAVVGALVVLFAAYAGIIAVLRTVGAALIRHRTENQYLHLGLGCLLFFVVRFVPWLGDWVTLGVGLVGLGSVIVSRAAGLWPKNRNHSGYVPA
jgi:uncharacterized membrane protein